MTEGVPDPLEVLLFVVDGYLSSMEIIEFGDTTGILPDPDGLEIIVLPVEG